MIYPPYLEFVILFVIPAAITLVLHLSGLRACRLAGWAGLVVVWGGLAALAWVERRCKGDALEAYYQCTGITPDFAEAAGGSALLLLVLGLLLWVLALAGFFVAVLWRGIRLVWVARR
jgi:hypothetical protein